MFWIMLSVTVVVVTHAVIVWFIAKNTLNFTQRCLIVVLAGLAFMSTGVSIIKTTKPDGFNLFVQLLYIIGLIEILFGLVHIQRAIAEDRRNTRIDHKHKESRRLAENHIALVKGYPIGMLQTLAGSALIEAPDDEKRLEAWRKIIYTSDLDIAKAIQRVETRFASEGKS